MADTQREKARKLVDSDVMTLGRETQRTRTSNNPVTQANMSAGKRVPFAKGGAAKGKMKKAAQVAGMLQALTQPQAGAPPGGMGGPPPGAAPMGAPMGAPPGPPGMKRGGRYAAGGHSDEAEDRVLFKKMFKQEESKEAKMKRGGHAKKKHVGSAADAEERGESAAEEAGENESSEGMKRGGICKKCGGRAHGGACKMATGGHMVPRHMAGRKGFAMGGPGKQRKGVMTPAGLPTKPKREPGNLI